MSNEQQHPATITCPLCQTNLRRAGHTHRSIVYACLCGATVREVQRPAGQRISIQWNNGPDTAA